jgi:hypothetical protein
MSGMNAWQCDVQSKGLAKQKDRPQAVSALERDARNRTGIFDLEANALPLSYTRGESNKAAKRRALA